MYTKQNGDGLLMIKRLLERVSSDRADSLISAVFILPVIFFMLITTVDMGIYMSNRGQIQAAARDGARTIAIMGGNGTNLSDQTSLMKKYGVSGSVCDGIKTTQANTPVECNVINGLNNSAGLVNITIHSVNCTPNVSTAVGEKVSCEVKWIYGGIPGSGMTFVRESGSQESDPALRGMQTTTGSGESEVKLADKA